VATVRLGEMLLARGLITRQQLDAALAAQLQFGGRLGTNLVELGLIDDGRLAACLSEQLGVPYVRPQALAAVPRDVIALMSHKLAKKYRAVPLRAQGNELHLCLADPQNFENLDELAFVLNRPLRPYVVTEVTLNYALERYYGIPRETRITAGPSGWRELGAASGQQAGVVPQSFGAMMSALPGTTPRPELGGQMGVVDQLAAVMSEEDVTTALFRYVTDLFAEVVLLAQMESVGGAEGGPMPVLAGNRSRARPCSQRTPLTLAEGSLGRALLAKPQVLHQPHLADAELGALCTAFGLPTDNVTLISIFNGPRAAYGVIGQGLDEAGLRHAFPGLKSMVAKTTQALHIVAIRNDIRVA
jgi:hypothetical protein